MSVMPSNPNAPVLVVRDALVTARQVTGLSPADFGLGLGIILGRMPTAQYVGDTEAGALCPPADYLIAAGQLSGTPVGVLVGELDDDETLLSRLEEQVAELRAAAGMD